METDVLGIGLLQKKYCEGDFGACPNYKGKTSKSKEIIGLEEAEILAGNAYANALLPGGIID